MVSAMVVAALTVHWPNVFFSAKRHRSAALVQRRRPASLALTGYGAYSLDSVLGLSSLWTPALTWAALAIGVLGGLANLGLRRPQATRRRMRRSHSGIGDQGSGGLVQGPRSAE